MFQTGCFFFIVYSASSLLIHIIKVVETGLPSGWEPRWSVTKKSPYYFNQAQSLSQWKPPQGTDLEQLDLYLNQRIEASHLPQRKFLLVLYWKFDHASDEEHKALQEFKSAWVHHILEPGNDTRLSCSTGCGIHFCSLLRLDKFSIGSFFWL